MRDARIDLSALRVNVGLLVSPRLVVDVAADAYGHGAIEVANAAITAGARMLRVRDADEESELRRAGIDVPIIVSVRQDGAESSAVYGVGSAARAHGFRPVMRVSAPVISLKTIDEGEPVSYGYTWRAPCRTGLALVPLGYADGLTRASSNRGSVWLCGSMRLIVGRVAMDVIVLELGSDIVALGDEAVLFGDPETGVAAVDEWALTIGLDALDVTAGIGTRVRRSYV